MTDRQLQAKLDKLTELANEIEDEAKRRYGPYGHLFFESAGTFHVMEGDSDRSPDRQDFVKFSSRGYCRMGSGAW